MRVPCTLEGGGEEEQIKRLTKQDVGLSGGGVPMQMLGQGLPPSAHLSAGRFRQRLEMIFLCLSHKKLLSVSVPEMFQSIFSSLNTVIEGRR